MAKYKVLKKISIRKVNKPKKKGERATVEFDVKKAGSTVELSAEKGEQLAKQGFVVAAS